MSFPLPLRTACFALTAIVAAMLLPHPVAAQSPAETAEKMFQAAQAQIEHFELDKGIAGLKKALPLAWESKDGYLLIGIYRWLGLASFLNDDAPGGEEAMGMSLQLLHEANDSSQLVATLKAAAGIARKKKLRPLYLRYMGELSQVYQQMPDLKARAAGLSEFLDELALPDDKDLACDTIEKLQPIYLKLADQKGFAIASARKARCRGLSGDSEGELTEYTTAIAAFRKTSDRAGLADALGMQAEALRSKERYLEALPLQQEAVSIRAALPDKHEYAESLNILALLHQDLGRLPLAVQLIEKSLALARQGGKKDHLASVLTNTAAIYRDVGRLDEATKLLQDALKIARDEHLDDQAKSAMQVLASIHLVQGDPLASLAAVAIAENETGKAAGDPDQFKLDSHNSGVALYKLGYYGKAAEIFEAELKRAEAGKVPAKIASAQEGLAGAYFGSERYTLAESHLIEAEKIYRSLGNPKALNNVLINLAKVLDGMGRYYDALARYDEVSRLSASMSAPRVQIETLLSTAELYRRLKSYDQALDDAQRAERLSQKQGFTATVGEAQRTQALIQLQSGNFGEAERLFRTAREAGTARPIINDGLVEVFLATHRFREAEEQLGRATPDDLAKAGVTYRIQYFTQRGIARLGLDRTSDAIADFSLAVGDIEDVRKQVTGHHRMGFLDAGSYGGRVRPYRGMLEAFATLSLSGARAEISIGDKNYDALSAAYRFAEEMRSRSMVEKLAFSRYDELSKSVPESVLAEEEQLVDRARALGKELENQKDPRPAQLREMNQVKAAAKAHLAALSKDYPQFARIISPSSIPIEELPVAKGELVLEYAIGLRSVYLFIIGEGHRFRLIRLPVQMRELENQVQVFRDLIVAKRFSPALANSLYKQLLGGVLPDQELPDRLVIVADGFLGLLPFEALVTKPIAADSAPAFLGAQHSVTYAQSASFVAWTRSFSRKSADKPLFAVADPIFSTDDPRYKPNAASASSAISGTAWHAGQGFRRLPETQTEIEKVASILGVQARPPDVLTGASATKSALLQSDLGAYRFLHFATHAAALGDPGVVNEPFLVLGQVGNHNGTDGVLTMSEIMDLKLNAELVVLAACDTGRGDVLDGDGVASLASAFQFAGAESVVLSLWELPSEASRDFMETFYRYIKDGRDKAEALRLSRDAMRKQHADPYYWAVFTLYSGANR